VIAGAAGATAGPSGVGVCTPAKSAPSPGVIASEVEVPVTVWKTAVLTAAAPMSDTPATATRRRRAPGPSSAVSRTHVGPGSAVPPSNHAPADTGLASTVGSPSLRPLRGASDHDTWTPALVRASCAQSNGRSV
jgi:hypothetical protein